jgi:proliferating cell nuclear antigen PCNA
MSDKSNYILQIKTNDGFALKILSEFFSSCLHRCIFEINDQGLCLNSVDSKEHRLLSMTLKKEKFILFYKTKNFAFDINSNHLYKIIKTIRKKDVVTLFILKDKPNKLGLTISHANESNESTSFIEISITSPSNISIPENNDSYHLTCSGKDFQKLKSLSSISNTLNIKAYPFYIVFYCDGEVVSKKIKIGENDSADDKLLIEENIQTSYITTLNKIANMSNNVIFYIRNDGMINIVFDIMSMGEFNIFIKTHRTIEEELNTNQEEEED